MKSSKQGVFQKNSAKFVGIFYGQIKEN